MHMCAYVCHTGSKKSDVGHNCVCVFASQVKPLFCFLSLGFLLVQTWKLPSEVRRLWEFKLRKTTSSSKGTATYTCVWWYFFWPTTTYLRRLAHVHEHITQVGGSRPFGQSVLKFSEKFAMHCQQLFKLTRKDCPACWQFWCSKSRLSMALDLQQC